MFIFLFFYFAIKYVFFLNKLRKTKNIVDIIISIPESVLELY